MKTIKDSDDLQTIKDNHLKKILMDLRRDKLIPRGYRPYCLRGRNAKKDHATNFAVVGIWVFFVVLAVGVLR